MKHYIVPLFALMATTQANGQELYFMAVGGPQLIRIDKINVDGTNQTTALTDSMIIAFLETEFPGSTLVRFSSDFFVDSVGRKLYLHVTYKDQTTGFRVPAILQSELDGTDIRVVVSPTPVEVNEVYTGSQVLQPSPSTIPAVGNIGLGILIASLIATGGWVISRRTGFGQTTAGGGA